jgi:hypothetical protein
MNYSKTNELADDGLRPIHRRPVGFAISDAPRFRLQLAHPVGTS